MKHENMKTASWFLDAFDDATHLEIDILTSIACTIQEKRKEMGLTQNELADMLKVSQGLVSRWENGEDNLTIGTLAKIATTMGIEMKSPLEDVYTKTSNEHAVPEGTYMIMNVQWKGTSGFKNQESYNQVKTKVGAINDGYRKTIKFGQLCG